jgi:hypothetical protein
VLFMHDRLRRLCRPLSSLAFIAALFVSAGCHSKSSATPANFITGLNAHFADHPECLLPQAPRFPYETSDPAEIKKMNALAAAQLLTSDEAHSLHVFRYTVTPAGTRYAPRFCYGNRVVSAIDHFTPPAPANGFNETTVTYRYTLQNVPVWAKSANVQAAFPELAHALTGESTATATLAGTMAGWQVPD